MNSATEGAGVHLESIDRPATIDVTHVALLPVGCATPHRSRYTNILDCGNGCLQ